MLKNFSKVKSPGPNGWIVDLFLHFFYLIGKDLVDSMEESRKQGYVPGNLNCTFVFVIPKKDRLEKFNDYMPISLCNLIYKVIKKVISNRINPILDRRISKDQFRFLSNRHILDAMGVT